MLFTGSLAEVATSDGPSVRIESDSTEVEVGGDFSIRCRTRNLQSPNFFRLEKRSLGSSTPIDLMTNSLVTTEFEETIDRYAGTFETDGTDVFIFIFTITGKYSQRRRF